MNNVLSLLLKELGQASTYTTLTAVLGVFGVTMTPGLMQTITFIGMGLAAVAGVLIKEGWQQAANSGDAVAALQAELAAVKAQLPPKV